MSLIVPSTVVSGTYDFPVKITSVANPTKVDAVKVRVTVP
jgi:hypothetical protein